MDASEKAEISASWKCVVKCATFARVFYKAAPTAAFHFLFKSRWLQSLEGCACCSPTPQLLAVGGMFCTAYHQRAATSLLGCGRVYSTTCLSINPRTLTVWGFPPKQQWKITPRAGLQRAGKIKQHYQERFLCCLQKPTVSCFPNVRGWRIPEETWQKAPCYRSPQFPKSLLSQTWEPGLWNMKNNLQDSFSPYTSQSTLFSPENTPTVHPERCLQSNLFLYFSLKDLRWQPPHHQFPRLTLACPQEST